MTMGFGDTHPGKLNPAIFARMVASAQKHGALWKRISSGTGWQYRLDPLFRFGLFGLL